MKPFSCGFLSSIATTAASSRRRPAAAAAEFGYRLVLLSVHFDEYIV
jgi:hypothetical protein